MDINVFSNISIRGRVAYAIMCFERYVLAAYPERNWKRVDDFMWKICDDSDFIDNTEYRYVEIVPECLLQFPDYESSDFDYLTEEEYNYYISIIPNDDDLNTIMMSVYDIAMDYAYTSIPKSAPYTLEELEKTISVLEKAGIDLPDVSSVQKYTFSESDGWGNMFDGRYLSIILNQN